MKAATMLRNLEHQLRTQFAMPRSKYITVNGETGVCSGWLILEPFEDKQIKEIYTDDLDIARLLHMLDETVKISVVPSGWIR